MALCTGVSLPCLLARSSSCYCTDRPPLPVTICVAVSAPHPYEGVLVLCTYISIAFLICVLQTMLIAFSVCRPVTGQLCREQIDQDARANDWDASRAARLRCAAGRSAHRCSRCSRASATSAAAQHRHALLPARPVRSGSMVRPVARQVMSGRKSVNLCGAVFLAVSRDRTTRPFIGYTLRSSCSVVYPAECCLGTFGLRLDERFCPSRAFV